MRKIPPSPFHGTSGFLLAEAPPQAPTIAVYPSAAARFSIAFDFARARFIFENIFELDVDIVLFMWYTSDTRTNFLNRFAIKLHIFVDTFCIKFNRRTRWIDSSIEAG